MPPSLSVRPRRHERASEAPESAKVTVSSGSSPSAAPALRGRTRRRPPNRSRRSSSRRRATRRSAACRRSRPARRRMTSAGWARRRARHESAPGGATLAARARCADRNASNTARLKRKADLNTTSLPRSETQILPVTTARVASRRPATTSSSTSRRAETQSIGAFEVCPLCTLAPSGDTASVIRYSPPSWLTETWTRPDHEQPRKACGMNEKPLNSSSSPPSASSSAVPSSPGSLTTLPADRPAAAATSLGRRRGTRRRATSLGASPRRPQTTSPSARRPSRPGWRALAPPSSSPRVCTDGSPPLLPSFVPGALPPDGTRRCPDAAPSPPPRSAAGDADGDGVRSRSAALAAYASVPTAQRP